MVGSATGGYAQSFLQSSALSSSNSQSLSFTHSLGASVQTRWCQECVPHVRRPTETFNAFLFRQPQGAPKLMSTVNNRNYESPYRLGGGVGTQSSVNNISFSSTTLCSDSVFNTVKKEDFRPTQPKIMVFNRLTHYGLSRMETNFPSVLPLFSSRLAGPNTAHDVTGVTQEEASRATSETTKLRFFSQLLPENTKVWNTSQTSLQHSMASEASWSTLCCRLAPLLASEHTPFQNCIFSRKGIYRSAIAAVTPDGSSNWIVAEELEPL